MPPLFAFAFAAEQKLVHSMHEMASRADHSKQMAEWSHEDAMEEHRRRLQRMATQKILAQPGMREANLTSPNELDEEREKRVRDKFRESVLNSGVRVVPGDSLGLHHLIANFWQENPFKILAVVSGERILNCIVMKPCS